MTQLATIDPWKQQAKGHGEAWRWVGLQNAVEHGGFESHGGTVELEPSWPQIPGKKSTGLFIV